MRERPTGLQISLIEDLARDLGLDDMARYRRLREITGRPVVMLTQLTPADAETVIAALRADANQQPLPFGGADA